MDNSDSIYRSLQRHLNRQTIGFPATKSGAEMRILKRLFTPEQAQLALCLTYKPATIEEISAAAREAGLTFGDLRGMLEAMAKNGALGHVERGGSHHFFTMPLVIGMYESQINNLTPEFIRDFEEYTTGKAFGLSFLSTELPQMRTIPIGKSIDLERRADVMTYDRMEDIIRGSAGPFAMIECICRKSAAMKGTPCSKTSRRETCTVIGDWAKNVIEYGVGRETGREETLEMARMSEAEGLIFQPSNTLKVDFVCACCGCCCGMLRIQKMLPKPVAFWAANYYASVNSQNCSGCGTCVERCQVNAVAVDRHKGVSTVNLDRCIGCGNCVTSCPTDSLKLVKKEKETVPPVDTQDLYGINMMHRKGAFGKMRVALKVLLGK